MLQCVAMTSNPAFCQRHCRLYAERLECVGSHISVNRDCDARARGIGMCMYSRDERDRLWRQKEGQQ